jgi:hypothetical protein
MKKKGRWIWICEASQSRAILYFQGGACNNGCYFTHRSIAAHLASASGATAWSIDYRLAPEHPHPAALEGGRRAGKPRCSRRHVPLLDPLRRRDPGGTSGGQGRRKVYCSTYGEHMKKRLSSIILYTAALLLAALLFTQKSDYALASVEHAWNSGHIIAFWLWTHLLVTRWPFLAARSHWQQFVIGMAIVILVSFAIEGIQDATGRSFSLDDIRKNVLGGAAAIFFTLPKRKYLNKMLRIGIQVIVLTALLFELAPLGRAVIDDIIIWHQFPVLCSFETPFEEKRWKSNTSLQIDRNIKKQGRASLKVNPNFGVYSRATLFSFARNWTGFQYLELDLYNPHSKAIYIKIAVHDGLFHRRGYQEKDRFVRPYKLPHGWNHIRIPIEDIRTAPREREMQMKDIREIIVLVWLHKKPLVIYIDELTLSPAP